MKLKQKIITIGMATMMLGGTVTTASILPSTVLTSTVSAAITGQTYVITAPDWLAMRSGDSTGYRLLKKIPKGRIVTVTKYNSKGTWGYTYYDGSGGWICLQAYAKKYNPSTRSANQQYQITASDYLWLRNADSTNGTALKKIPKGSLVTVTKYNSNKTWGYTTYNGQPGWICLQAYAKPYSSTTTKKMTSPWNYSATPTRALYNTRPYKTGNDVKWVQQALNITVNAGLPIDGGFGNLTEAATKKFQKKHGLTQDGSFGPATRAKMVSVLKSLGYREPVPTTVEAKIKAQQQNVKKYALNKVGTKYANGMCLGFVESVYVNSGFNTNVNIKKPGNDCAYHSATKWRKSAWKAAKSWGNSSIPIGATVYIDNNSYCGVKCKTHKTWCDHVGIYVGSGYVVHASGGVIKKEKLTKWGNLNVSWGFAGVTASAYSGSSFTK